MPSFTFLRASLLFDLNLGAQIAAGLALDKHGCRLLLALALGSPDFAFFLRVHAVYTFIENILII
jgi:hypothetical protein